MSTFTYTQKTNEVYADSEKLMHATLKKLLNLML